jgi:hypothetical protein
MQNQLPAAHALPGQKPAHLDVLSYRKPCNLIGNLVKRQRIHFALYLPQNFCFSLLRGMAQCQCQSRNPGRGITQTFQCDQLAADYYLIKRQFPMNLNSGCRAFFGLNRSGCHAAFSWHGPGFFFLHHRGRLDNGSLGLDGQMTQYRIVEAERMLQLVQR